MEVFIKWMHGDADFYTDVSYKFKTLKEVKSFLNFIYDLRRFIPNSGYENLGYFSDGYNESIPSWRKKIVKKHGGKFDELVEKDRSGDDGFSACVESIFVKIKGIEHYIFWTKSRKKVKLPIKGEVVNLTTGDINGYGQEVFGGKSKDYLDGATDFKELGKHKGTGTKSSDYPKIKGIVIDCKVNFYDVKKEKYDFENLNYIILCKNEKGKFTIEKDGYDSEYENKFGRSYYGNIKIIEV